MISGLFGVTMAEFGHVQVADRQVLLYVASGGALAVAAGLSYQALRSILARRHLPLTRYRGPSVILLLALGIVGGEAAGLPFTGDVRALIEGRPMSLGGSIVLLTATQLTLVSVTALFVALPRALAGVPPFDGGAALRSVALGLGVGVLAWIGASLVAAVVALALQSVGLPILPGPAEQAIASVDPILVVVAVVGVAPLAEEIFFRGVVFNAWLREYGRRRALIGSAGLFALIHVSLLSLLPIFLLGLILAWLYERSRSLLSAVVVHATVNGISVTIALLVRFGVFDLPAPLR